MMSGRDEKPNHGGGIRAVTPTIEEYREDIQHVLTWMNNSGLNFELRYTIVELSGFTLMAGIGGTLRWTDMVARGVKRALEEANVLFPGVFRPEENVNDVG